MADPVVTIHVDSSELDAALQKAEALRLACSALRDRSGRKGEAGELLDAAWGVIANAFGGDFDRADARWRDAAIRWRDSFFEFRKRG